MDTTIIYLWFDTKEDKKVITIESWQENKILPIQDPFYLDGLPTLYQIITYFIKIRYRI